jgi:hypothetical protein
MRGLLRVFEYIYVGSVSNYTVQRYSELVVQSQLEEEVPTISSQPREPLCPNIILAQDVDTLLGDSHTGQPHREALPSLWYLRGTTTKRHDKTATTLRTFPPKAKKQFSHF